MAELQTHHAFVGRRILVVEDEAIIALSIADILTDAGGVVIGPASSASEALLLIENESVDCAVLDLHLGREEDASRIADWLAQANVPFIFVTGYSEHRILSRHASRPVILKPYEQQEIVAALTAMVQATKKGLANQ